MDLGCQCFQILLDALVKSMIRLLMPHHGIFVSLLSEEEREESLLEFTTLAPSQANAKSKHNGRPVRCDFPHPKSRIAP